MILKRTFGTGQKWGQKTEGYMTPESKLKRDIWKFLRSLEPDGFFITVNDRFKSGPPEIMGVINGRCVVIEVKRPGKEPTPIQWHYLDEFRKAGAIAIVAHSVEEVKEEIGELGDWEILLFS